MPSPCVLLRCSDRCSLLGWAHRRAISSVEAETGNERLMTIPPVHELEPFRYDRECTEIASELQQKYPHLKREDGFYNHPTQGPGDHAWNIAPDGTIVDMTSIQHDDAYDRPYDEPEEGYQFPAPQSHPE